MKKHFFILSLIFILCSCGENNNYLSSFLKEYQIHNKEGEAFINGVYLFQTSYTTCVNNYQKNTFDNISNIKYTIYADLNFSSESYNLSTIQASVNSIDIKLDYYYLNNDNEYKNMRIISNKNGTSIVATLKNDKIDDSYSAFIPDYSIINFKFEIYSDLSEVSNIKQYFKNDNDKIIDDEFKNVSQIITSETIYIDKILRRYKLIQLHYPSLTTHMVDDYIYTFDDNFNLKSYKEYRRMNTDFIENEYTESWNSYYITKIEKYNFDILDTTLPIAKYISNDEMIDTYSTTYFVVSYDFIKEDLIFE